MNTPYFDAIQLAERLHRYFLDVVKAELDKRSIEDISNVQAMILYNIGHDELTVGELTMRGYGGTAAFDYASGGLTATLTAPLKSVQG